MARPVFVGIDVKFAKGDLLPVSICELDGSFARPLPRRIFPKPPRGRGNVAALEPSVRSEFATEVLAWLRAVCTKEDLLVERIAIDAPSDYCRSDRDRRAAEIALDKLGISSFATPTEGQFARKIQEARAHLEDGGDESHLPNANQIWMLIGFELFRKLEQEYDCIEVYPQAIVKAIGCTGEHKSTDEGYDEQISALAEIIDVQQAELDRQVQLSGFGNRDDKLDAYMSAWIASLAEGERLEYGDPPADVIWVPNVESLADPQKVIDKLLEETDRSLWAAYQASVDGNYGLLRSNHLVFPKYRRTTSNDVRVSEQEARALFSRHVDASCYLYALEVPTELDYQQKGIGHRSALIDLCLCDSASAKTLVNIEFKSGGCSIRSADCSRIGKDLEKLLHEKSNAIWFHTLEAVDCGTIPDLIAVISDEISRIANNTERIISEKKLVFHLCVLRQGFAIQKTLEVCEYNLQPQMVEAFFQFNCRVSRVALDAVTVENGWKILKNRESIG